MFQPPKIAKLEYHVANACNLSCNFCCHYSDYTQPLGAVTPYEALAEWTVWEKLVEPGRFILIGGEPTLNKNLETLCETAFNVWGHKSVITLYTNGAFIERFPSLPELFARRFGSLVVSLHFADESKNAEVMAKFDPFRKRGVPVEFNRASNGWRKWYQKDEDGNPKPYESKPAEAFKRCSAKYCTVLRNGKLYKCPQVAYADTVKGIRENFPFFASYEACEPTQEAVTEFFSTRYNNSEQCCSHCPERVVTIGTREGL